MAHTRQPRPDSGLGVQVKFFETFAVVASWLGSSAAVDLSAQGLHWDADVTGRDQYHEGLCLVNCACSHSHALDQEDGCQGMKRIAVHPLDSHPLGWRLSGQRISQPRVEGPGFRVQGRVLSVEC